MGIENEMMNFTSRLARLRQLLTTYPCDGLLIEHPTHLFYLTGLDLSAGKLLITHQNACLIVDGRYFESSTHQKLYPVRLINDHLLKELIPEFHIHQLGFDKHYTTYHAFLSLTKLGEELHSGTYSLEIVPVESAVQKLRLIKDEDEIAALRKAARLGFQGYEFLLSLLKDGISEAQLAFDLEFFWKERGASRLAFDSIIAFGTNSSMPHYRAGQTKLKQDTSILIDIGVVLNHYHSDMTRVIFFGKPQPIIEEIYSIVEEAKSRASALCKPGTLIGDLDRTAREFIASKGYDDYFTHSLGHGVGLDIHEPPTVRETGLYSNVPLQPGMIFTIEPGIYLPNVGGVRLEDTLLITEDGYENLTQPEIQSIVTD